VCRTYVLQKCDTGNNLPELLYCMQCLVVNTVAYLSGSCNIISYSFEYRIAEWGGLTLCSLCTGVYRVVENVAVNSLTSTLYVFCNVGNAGAGGAALRPPVNNMPFCRAELQKNVRNLHELWLEYEVGSGGRKPVKFFTPQERGLKTNKDRFCRRKVFWDCVRKHVDASISAAVAIERIQDAYGHRLGVTALCLAMKKDLPQGHPNLRV
jgi:hypothetical protein